MCGFEITSSVEFTTVKRFNCTANDKKKKRFGPGIL